jgi:hypothetical protein
VYCDERARVVYIVQAKYRAQSFGKAEQRSTLNDFAAIAQTVCDPKPGAFASFLSEMDTVAADALREVRQRVVRKDYRLVLIFVTLGRCSQSTERDAKQITRRAAKSCSLEIIDGRRCLVLLRDYLDGAAPPIPTLDVPIEAGPGVKVNGVLQRYDEVNKLESWVFSVKGDAIAHMFEAGGRRLFARNIRGFLGTKMPVNESMLRTIETEPTFFFYYNNGITIACDRAERVSQRGTDVLRVSNPQVINGQQTSRVLATAPASADASVLVKIIQIPRERTTGKDHFEGLIGRIVQGTNWQSAIKPSDLMANDRRQLSIEKELRHHGYFYARKRQTKGEIRSQMRGQYIRIITKEELAQAIAGCELDPVVARSGKDNLFVGKLYMDVFPNTDAEYFLPRYWMFREVTRGAKGAPQRGYTKWLVLNYCWGLVGPLLRSKTSCTRFVDYCKDENRLLTAPLERFINIAYVQALAYYRAHRGRGESEMDVSLFFRSKKGRHKEFASWWERVPARLRQKVQGQLDRIQAALEKDE